ncbi:FecCD family ABC transporter permease [Brevibacterium casei]|uniref:Iron complex transport system permease protein n=1 Tax=Brevibacterium casei CIP 102111 TaxID=1255625 RepID=A0A2H1KKH9_9MICO|nr:iron chelate uptake ABC transporter family permease subunit [Brevibacterium casei]QPR40136.1 iron chelate uptake ABC transporter family permease subunit [Brevibacterium casei]QPR44291.1 iron chelate uptake ABC transporter family permease subunit [Brevibacterium casei]SMY00257.1 iron complex transport system permease protein [Brevibacterium casei CIP 102111]
MKSSDSSTALVPGGAVAPGETIDFGRPMARVFGLRVDVRVVVTAAIVTLLALICGFAGLLLGKFTLTPAEVVEGLFGVADKRIVNTVVGEWRAPRILAGIVLGAGLGVSGAVFQSLTRNPLGSPDIIGFSTGAYTGGIVTIIVFGTSFVSTAAGAIIGGMLTALLVYLLTWKGGVQGFRLIIVGIALTAMLGAFNTWLIMRVDLDLAMAAATWGAGSLNGMGWSTILPAAIAVVVLSLGCGLFSRDLGTLELGDDTAKALGVRNEPVRAALILIAVALVAVVTAAAGPIAFVALAAPQIGRRLARSQGTSLLMAAAVGALLLVAADLIAQHALGETQLPVGVVTVCIGGVYLIWLLIQEARRAQ